MEHLAIRRRARAQTSEGEEALEAGFTLVELMVVLLIIAILLAIAIPTFLGLTSSANDRSAQSTLTNALSEGKTLYGADGAYANQSGTAYSQSDFTSVAPEYQWNYNSVCPTNVGNCVSALVFDAGTTGDSEGLSLAVDSTTTNTCWYIFDVEVAPGVVSSEFPTAGTFYGKQTGVAGGCAALNPNTDANTPGINFTGGGGQNYSSAIAVN